MQDNEREDAMPEDNERKDAMPEDNQRKDATPEDNECKDATPDRKRPRRFKYPPTNSDKTIRLTLCERQDYDITEDPSCCTVFAGKYVTFESDSPFRVTFDSGSPFSGPIFQGLLQPPGSPTNYAITLLVENVPAGSMYKYGVTLYDSTELPHRDDHCPTIIVGN